MSPSASVTGTGGIRTLSITWMIPFEAMTSARMTFASFTITPSPTVKVKSSPFTAAATNPSVTAEDGTAPDTTW